MRSTGGKSRVTRGQNSGVVRDGWTVRPEEKTWPATHTAAEGLTQRTTHGEDKGSQWIWYFFINLWNTSTE